VTEDTKAKVLQLTYKEFFAVLRKWDGYTSLEVSKTPRETHYTTNEYGSGGGDVPLDCEIATSMPLSKLARPLWRSLTAGAGEVDRIHDETYQAEQIEFFNQCYASAERIAGDRHYWGYPLTPQIEPPAEMLLKFRKEVQTILVRDGHLQRAVENYQQGVDINEAKERAAIAAREQELRAAREHRADPNYVRPLQPKTKLEVRGLDREQCVFCGVTVKQYRYVRLLPTGHTAVDVVLACPACASQLNGQSPDAAGRMRLFGRYQLVLPL